MRQYLVQVEESACEKFEGMIDLCPDVKIVGVDVVIDTKDVVDQCMVDAIRALREDMVFNNAWLMLYARYAKIWYLNAQATTRILCWLPTRR